MTTKRSRDPVTGAEQDFTDGAASFYLGLLLAGEANIASATLSYLRTHEKCKLAVVSKTSACVIGGSTGAGDTALVAVVVSAALTGTCVISGFFDTDGNAQSYTLPVGFVGERNFHGVTNDAGQLTVTCSNASDDNLVGVIYYTV